VLVRRVCENQGVLAVFMFEKIIDPADCYDHVLQVTGMNNREIGDLLDVDYSSVSLGRSRLRKKIAEEKHIRLLVRRIEQLCQG
jgi:hypothetical protein